MRLHYCVTKASSIPLCLPDPVQMEEVDTVSYPASQFPATSVNVHQLTHLVMVVVPCNVPSGAPLVVVDGLADIRCHIPA